MSNRIKAKKKTSHKKIYAIILVLVLLIAWWLRYYQTYIGSPIPGGWGVNIDWTRHSIAESGQIISTTESRSILSSYRGSQSYDWVAITLGIVTVVMGTSLDGTLRVLNAVPIVGFLLIPSVFFILYKRIVGEVEFFGSVGVLIFAISVFPSVRVVFKTALGWYPEPYATALLLLTLLMLPRAKDSKSNYVVFIILVTVTLNTYHTWVFFFLLICMSVIIIDKIFRFTTSSEVEPVSGLLTAVSIGILFYLTGITLSGRFDELARTATSLFLYDSSNDFWAAANSDLIGASASQALNNVDMRRSLSLINYASTFSLVILYGLSRIEFGLNSYESVLNEVHDRLIFFSLVSFPLIITVFFSMGGLGTAVGRTQYIGIYFAIFCLIYLLANYQGIVQKASVVLALLLVLSTIGGVALHSGTYTANQNPQEASAIEFTGSEVPNEKAIFSDVQMGMPLLYYQQDAVITVQVTNQDWEQRALAIFYTGSNITAAEAVRSSVEYGLTEEIQEDEDVYLLLSDSMAKNGPALFSYQLKPANGLLSRYDRNDRFHKIYSNQDSTLYVNHSERR